MYACTHASTHARTHPHTHTHTHARTHTHTHTHTYTHTHTPFSSSKLLHDSIPLLLGHVSMHGRHSEVSLSHFFCEPFDLFNIAITTAGNSDSHRCTYEYAYIHIQMKTRAHTHTTHNIHYTHTHAPHTHTHTHTHLSLCVAENDSLCDGECIIEITECVELPLFFLNCHKELLDSFQGQLITERERKHLNGRITTYVCTYIYVLSIRKTWYKIRQWQINRNALYISIPMIWTVLIRVYV